MSFDPKMKDGYKLQADPCKRNLMKPYESEVAVVTGPAIPPMTPDRAICFLERFKREEKMLGPSEQAALEFAIEALRQPPPPAERTLASK